MYRVAGEKFLFAGVAVLIWRLMNFLEHSVYTLIDLQISPGLFTSFLFAFIGVAGLVTLYQMKKMSFKLMISSFLTALFYAGLPVLLQIIFSPIFREIYI